MIQRDGIYLASFPFGDKAGMKLRPVLALTGPIGSVPEVLVAYISSVVPDPLLPFDILLDPAVKEHAATNLKVRSVLRLHKLATIHSSSVVRRLGSLTPDVRVQVEQKVLQLLEL
ncbi:MAG: type II toxin-antitoxin system PemK/MazF family toxin [Pirellulales bacterium]